MIQKPRHAEGLNKTIVDTKANSVAWPSMETLEPRLLLAVIAVAVDSLDTNDTTPQLTGTVGDIAASIQVTVDG